MTRATIALIASVLLVACARQGAPTGSDVFAAEQASWQNLEHGAGLDPKTRPISIRNLQCEPDENLFQCNYDVDYGVDGNVAGTRRRTNWLIGRNEQGEWSPMIRTPAPARNQSR